MVTTGFKFLVNGHYDFHKGAAENPVIGSIEDWYIINTINLAHPIHVHLINFQVT
jgi:spore coat protein A